MKRTDISFNTSASLRTRISLVHREIGLERPAWLCSEISSNWYKNLNPAEHCRYIGGEQNVVYKIHIDPSECK